MNSIALDSFPPLLKAERHFVLYQKHVDKGEVKKRPYDWLGGRRGNDSPELQMTWGEALRKAQSRSDLGVAIFQPEGGTQVSYGAKSAFLHIVDCDGFIAPVNGKPTMLEWGWDIVDQCEGSYSEETVSRNGFKIFVLSDLEPQTKQTFRLPPNQFAELFPDIRKYGLSHAVEIFSKSSWNVITGHVIHRDYADLKFVPKRKLLDFFSYLESKGPQRSQEISSLVESPRANGFQNKLGLITALSKIDNQSEANWNEVAYSLARVLGALGADLFLGFSRGDYNGNPYGKFAEDEVRDRYVRALLEVQKRPAGYGLNHLSRLSGLPISAITLEAGSIAPAVAGVTAAELAGKTFAPLEWVVEGILPEGCYLLSARPKVGKSWFALQICTGVAFGESVLGRDVKQGKAIYLALEDNHRRLQSRLQKLRPTGYATEDLVLHTKWPRFNEGGVEALVKAIEESKPRIVVIDTLAKVRPPTNKGSGIYESDYAALAPITDVANRFRTTIVIIHHNRKGKAETDPLEQISGSLGLAGAVDGALIIDGNRGDPSYTLSLIGRDIPNDDDLAISLQSNGKWVVLGAAKEVFISQERQAIRELMVLHPNGLKPSEVVELTGKKSGTVRKLMRHMVGDGQLINVKGTYSLPTLTSSSGDSSEVGTPGNSGNSGNRGKSADIEEAEEVTELPVLPVLHG